MAEPRIVFSAHARNRLMSRRVSEAQALAAIHAPLHQWTTRQSRPHHGDAAAASGLRYAGIDGQLLVVVVVSGAYKGVRTVITLWASKALPATELVLDAWRLEKSERTCRRLLVHAFETLPQVQAILDKVAEDDAGPARPTGLRPEVEAQLRAVIGGARQEAQDLLYVLGFGSASARQRVLQWCRVSATRDAAVVMELVHKFLTGTLACYAGLQTTLLRELVARLGDEARPLPVDLHMRAVSMVLRFGVSRVRAVVPRAKELCEVLAAPALWPWPTELDGAALVTLLCSLVHHFLEQDPRGQDDPLTVAYLSLELLERASMDDIVAKDVRERLTPTWRKRVDQLCVKRQHQRADVASRVADLARRLRQL